MVDVEKIRKEVKHSVDRNRYLHTLSVAYTASCLAMAYGADPERAYLAGILHDCAKGFSDQEKFDRCKKYRIELTSVEKSNPALIHAKLGAYLARTEFEIEDEEVISAVNYHTTGKPDMSLLEKIIFTSDYIEFRRNQAPRLPEIRQKAFSDLDEAVYMILSDTVNYLSGKNRETIDEMTQKTYEFYRQIHDEKLTNF